MRWILVAALFLTFGTGLSMAGAKAGTMHINLVCDAGAEPSGVAVDYAKALCTAVASALHDKSGATIEYSTLARLKGATNAVDGQWALLRVSVSGAYTAKSRLSMGTAAQLAKGGGRSSAEIGTHMSDAVLNSVAAANQARALLESLPD